MHCEWRDVNSNIIVKQIFAIRFRYLLITESLLCSLSDGAYHLHLTQETPPTHHLVLYTLEVGDFLDSVKK